MPERPNLLKSSVSLLEASARPDVADVIRHIPLDDLTPDPNQPRKNFDDPADDEASGTFASLVESIRRDGVLEPLLVYRHPRTDQLLILAGERRLRAAREAGLTHVPCLERAVSDDTNIRRLQLTENIERKGLSLWEIATALNEMAERHPEVPRADLAAQFGLKSQRLSDLLWLVSARASSDTRDALRHGHLGDVVSARLFDRLPTTKRAELLSERRFLRRGELENLHREATKAAVGDDPSAERTATIVLPNPSDLMPPPPQPLGGPTPVPPAPAPSPPSAAPELPRTVAFSSSDLRAERELVHLPPITRAQLVTLYEMLGATTSPPASDADIAASFLALLNAS